MNIALIVICAVLVWFILGFIAFLIEAKMENCIKFDKEARCEFKACLLLGLVAFIIILCMVLYDWFCNTFMDGLLFKINGKKQDKIGDKDCV